MGCVSLQRVYQKDYHQTKTKTHLPPDIIANQVAKRCQDMLSDVLYRTYLHQWTCHPEQEDAIRARKTNEILSDVGPCSVLICCLCMLNVQHHVAEDWANSCDNCFKIFIVDIQGLYLITIIICQYFDKALIFNVLIIESKQLFCTPKQQSNSIPRQTFV